MATWYQSFGHGYARFSVLVVLLKEFAPVRRHLQLWELPFFALNREKRHFNLCRRPLNRPPKNQLMFAPVALFCDLSNAHDNASYRNLDPIANGKESIRIS